MQDAHFIILVLVVLCGNVVEAVTGFGSTITAVTIGAHAFKIDTLVTTLVPLNIIISIYIVVRHRSGLNVKELLGGILPMTGVGLAAGIIIFNTADIEILKKLYGAFVFAFSAFEVVRILRLKQMEEAPLGRVQAAFWLIFGGVMQGIYASGGPMVVYYASRKLKDKRTFRSTLSGLWLILNITMFISHLISGKTDAETLKTSAMLLPALLGGIVLGEWIHTRIPERVFRIVVFAILLVAGASLALGR